MIVTREKPQLEILKDELKSYSRGRLYRLLKSPLRTILPRIMRRLGVTRNKTLPLFWGASFYGVLPEAISSLIWRFGYFDPKTSINILNNLEEGGVFIDIGAHFGYFTLLASSVVGESGKVVAIEAMPSTFDRLQNNIRKNCLEDRCTVVNCAAYDRETELEFKDYGLALSSLNSAFGIRNDKVRTGSYVHNVSVQARTLDSILEGTDIRDVDVVKIDAESSEYFVLQGMSRTLEQYHPMLIVELGDEGVAGSGKSTKDVIEFLKLFGYVPYELVDNTLQTVQERDKYSYCNLVFK
jgi:FkbM family methyltransferase